jgi:probable rRNA maturation factor
VPGGLEVEVIGAERARGAVSAQGAAALCRRALSAAGIGQGHVAVEFVDPDRIRALNRDHRGRDAPTDVLSFPVDGAAASAGPRELGDVVICPELAADVAEAVVHGALHLAGMDHETDGGEMLALQRRLLAAP